MRLPLTVLSLVVLFAAGCATDRYRPPLKRWDKKTSRSDAPRPVAAEPEAEQQDDAGEDKLLTAREFADRFLTGGECETAARSLLTRNGKQGVALMRACLGRADSTDLGPFSHDLWGPQLHDAAGMSTLGYVLANRGGWLIADLPRLQRRKVPVLSLAQAMAAPDEERGRIVVVRAHAVGPRPDLPQQLVLEEMSLGGDADDPESLELIEAELLAEEGATLSSSAPTGALLLVEPHWKDPFPRGGDVIVVAEFLGLELVQGADETDEEPHAVLRVLSRHPPAPTLRGN